MSKKNNIVSRLDYLHRHLQNILPHLTINKILNLIFSEFELKTTKSLNRGLPAFLKIESSSVCQIHCTGCKVSKQKSTRSAFMTLDNLKQIVDPIADKLIFVSLSHLGEPMMNKNLYKLAGYLHSKNIGVSFPTNLSLELSDDAVDSLITSGVDTILVSMDGATSESYSVYRAGGNFDLVLDNVRRIQASKKSHGYKTPRLVWKFVKFEHNKHEVNIALTKYKEMGFDSVEINQDFNGKEWSINNSEMRAGMIENKIPCYWPWHSMVIQSDGKVLPCYNNLVEYGDSKITPISQIWNNPEYTKLRKVFSRKGYGEGMPHYCRICMGLEKPGTESAAG